MLNIFTYIIYCISGGKWGRINDFSVETEVEMNQGLWTLKLIILEKFNNETMCCAIILFLMKPSERP